MNQEERVIRDYCRRHHISLSAAFKDALFEKIEDEYDLKCAEEAIKRFEEDPRTIPWEEVKKKFDL